MMYDFKTQIDRTDTGSIKTDIAPESVKDSGLVPLSVADMELPVAPEIIEAVKKAADKGIFGYTYADRAYTETVRSWMKDRHSFDTEGFKLITTNGVVPALRFAVEAFCEKGEGVVIQPPVYMMFKNAIETAERRVVENPLIFDNGRYVMDYDDLDRKTAPEDVKLLLLCSPHNPVGRAWTKEELIRLGEICRKNGVIVVADEIHNDLLLNGAEHTVFAALPGMDDISITCTATSKTFNLAGLSCSNIFIKNESIAESFKNAADRAGAGLVPYFARAATIAAYTQCAAWVDELNAHIYANFELMYSFIEKELPMLKVIRAEGTYLAWLDMRALGLDDGALEKLMLSHGLALDEGYLFGVGGSGFERWNLALPSDILLKALERLKLAVNKAALSR
ncbi:MAG: pyridoxal phosphate-dependent aminotransferase [Clostridia bacterium]|nr:pyridoxal phosphate-dependent aminotransferase [Clostridia bacterium]